LLPPRFPARDFIILPSIDKPGEFFYILKTGNHRKNSREKGAVCRYGIENNCCKTGFGFFAMVEMKVEGLTLDPLTNMPIIILKDLTGTKALPIWVGIFEANAIALEIEKISTPRPMTHDLLKNMIHGLKAQIIHILVNELKDNTFYAVISLKSNGNTLNIDSRPSDAIALALRVKAPIFVEEKVIEAAKSIDIPDQEKKPAEDKDQWKKWLENIKPQDFGDL